MNKPELELCLKLLDNNFSLITVGEDKKPNFPWKAQQTKPLTKVQFESNYNYMGGARYFSKAENKEIETPASKNIGIVTGYNGLECIDIDTKVLNTLPEKELFWKEFISLCTDHIEDFDKKFVIAKTVSGGFHILYRCENPEGNKKIARPKHSKEALIESRGVGGYVFLYSTFVQGGGYTNIQVIDNDDRELLWNLCKYFNYVEDNEPDTIKYKTVEKELHEVQVKPWEDYNKRTDIWDLIRHEFTIVRKLSNKTIIKREGAKSAHSGYIFDNSRCMFLFSTGTKYPAEKLLSPFAVYTIQSHYGNFSEAAKQLYKNGYGSRIKNVKPPKIKHEKNIINTDNFPLEIFPDAIQNYIIQIHKTLNASIDYLGCSLLWVISLCIGNSIKLEVKRGWLEAAVLWIAIVGRAGIGKTHNIYSITFPLLKINEREIRSYNENMIKYRDYMAMDKKEKSMNEPVKEPIKTQFIVGDITLEAFFDHHENNKNGIGILRDELSGWIKDLNKYRAGSDLETYLSCWSNQQIILTRKTAKSAYVSNAFVPIIGGVQPSILANHYTSENKDNGFMDRWLLCYPELQVEDFNENEISQELLDVWFDFVVGLFDGIKKNAINYDAYGNIVPIKARFSNEAKKEYKRIFNKITSLQNSEEENEYMKSILPKQKSYVARFALILNTLYYTENDKTGAYDEITKEAVLGAEKLSDYFIKMAKKNKIESIETKEIKDNIKHSNKHSPREQFEVLYEINPELNRSKVAEELGVSRTTIKNWISELGGK